MSSLCQLWGKGALARDAVPAPVTTRWKSEARELQPRKARVLKRAIRVCLVAEKRKEREELEKQRKEAEAKGLTIQDLESKDNVHLKIVQHEERLDELQKEKHKLFLTLKKVLLNEKKQQTAAVAATQKALEPMRTQAPMPSAVRPRMSQEEWGTFGRPSMAPAPRMYMAAAYPGPSTGMRQAPSMLQQFGGFGSPGQPQQQQQQQQQMPQQQTQGQGMAQSPSLQPQMPAQAQQQSSTPSRPTMLHSGSREFSGAFGRGGGGGSGGGTGGGGGPGGGGALPSRGMGRGRGQFAGAGPSWRYQDTKRGGRGGTFRKDGYYSTPGRM